MYFLQQAAFFSITVIRQIIFVIMTKYLLGPEVRDYY